MTTMSSMHPGRIGFTDTSSALKAYQDIHSKTGIQGAASQLSDYVAKEKERERLAAADDRAKKQLLLQEQAGGRADKQILLQENQYKDKTIAEQLARQQQAMANDALLIGGGASLQDTYIPAGVYESNPQWGELSKQLLGTTAGSPEEAVIQEQQLKLIQGAQATPEARNMALTEMLSRAGGLAKGTRSEIADIQTTQAGNLLAGQTGLDKKSADSLLANMQQQYPMADHLALQKKVYDMLPKAEEYAGGYYSKLNEDGSVLKVKPLSIEEERMLINDGYTRGTLTKPAGGTGTGTGTGTGGISAKAQQANTATYDALREKLNLDASAFGFNFLGKGDTRTASQTLDKFEAAGIPGRIMEQALRRMELDTTFDQKFNMESAKKYVDPIEVDGQLVSPTQLIEQYEKNGSQIYIKDDGTYGWSVKPVKQEAGTTPVTTTRQETGGVLDENAGGSYTPPKAINLKDLLNQGQPSTTTPATARPTEVVPVKDRNLVEMAKGIFGSEPTREIVEQQPVSLGTADATKQEEGLAVDIPSLGLLAGGAKKARYSIYDLIDFARGNVKTSAKRKTGVFHPSKGTTTGSSAAAAKGERLKKIGDEISRIVAKRKEDITPAEITRLRELKDKFPQFFVKP